MTRRRHTEVRSAVVISVVGVLAAGLAVAQPAASAPRNKANYYSASADPSTVRSSTATTPTTVTFTITNCGTAFAPPADCSNVKGTSIDSITITLPSGWAAVNPANLSATGLKLAPGASKQMAVQVVPSTTGAGTAQAVSLCVSDTTLCSFQPASAGVTLELPLKFSFAQSPANGIPATSLCGTKVQLTDGFTPADNVTLSGVAVTLDKDTGSLDPTLSFDSTNTPTTNSSGLATFDSVTPCLPQPAVGGPYTVVAVGQNAGATIPSATSSSFVVFTTLKNCGGSCNDTENGVGGTRLDATVTNARGNLGTSTFDAVDAHYPSFTCTGVKKIDGRPDVLQASADGDKHVVITWSKQVTLKFTDNGTPHWQVCMQAPATFITDSGLPAAQSGAFYVGSIPLCGTAGLPAGNPCMVVSRNAAQEIATITLPAGWAGDPYFH